MSDSDVFRRLQEIQQIPHQLLSSRCDLTKIEYVECHETKSADI